MSPDARTHEPCMLQQTLDILQPEPGDIALDCTLGLGGHAKAILEKTAPDGPFIGIDWDPQMLDIARERLGEYSDRMSLFNENFTALPRVLDEAGVDAVDVAILDAGVARPHFVDPSRGFSFDSESLDMRMSPDAPETAEAVINSASEEKLRDIFRVTQNEREARRIARRIVNERRSGRITSCAQLADLIVDAVGHSESKRQPASALLAVRIFINDELDNLAEGVEAMARSLRAESGRMAILTYHSAEFRTVHETMKYLERGTKTPPWMPTVEAPQPVIKRLVKRAMHPADDAPPTCRSARLFAAVAV